MEGRTLPLRLLRSPRASSKWTPRFSSKTGGMASLSDSATHRATATEQSPIQAAPEFNLTTPASSNTAEPPQKLSLSKLRVVPTSASYFSGKPNFNDDLLKLQDLLRKYQTLPQCEPEEAPKVAWITYVVYRNSIGEEPVKAARYSHMVGVLKRLNLIHPSVRPLELEKELSRYRKAYNPQLNLTRPIIVDEFGRTRGVGRRKTSSAEVWLVEGEGEVLVNGKSLSQAFARLHDRESVIWSLKATERLDKYNMWALVKGGGTTGQAEALTLGVTKALLAHEPLLKKPLRQAGVVTRDPRRVERKKPGKEKARKMPAWVKR
ncbi:MAG: 37S ribosomal protein S9, mitochondrial [Chrysothrix sp. TS-e1954]|nr:MAG: 37S ribosomal protein S9, mitochondrial [Chrysothrix sp. TS-e1954]